MDHALDSLGKLNEGAEFRQARHRSFYRRANREALGHIDPRISQSLLETQGESPLGRIYSQDDDLDCLSFFHYITGFPDFALRPGHFGNMNQAFDPRFEFYESAKFDRSRDCAPYAISDFVLLSDCIPRMRLKLLHSDRDALFLSLAREL